MSSLTSAGLLNLLVFRQRSLAGDRAGQQLVGQLLEAAAEPYFGILRQWLCSGVLDDPYKEFMVKVCARGVCVCCVRVDKCTQCVCSQRSHSSEQHTLKGFPCVAAAAASAATTRLFFPPTQPTNQPTTLWAPGGCCCAAAEPDPRG